MIKRYVPTPEENEQLLADAERMMYNSTVGAEPPRNPKFEIGMAADKLLFEGGHIQVCVVDDPEYLAYLKAFPTSRPVSNIITTTDVIETPTDAGIRQQIITTEKFVVGGVPYYHEETQVRIKPEDHSGWVEV